MDYFKVSRLFLYTIPFALVIVTTSTLFPFIVGKYAWFRTASALALVFFLLGLAFDKRAGEYLNRLRQIVKSPLFIGLTTFTVAFLIAGFVGINPHFSFWSNFERGEGGLQLLHLYVFFVLLLTLFRSDKEWKLLAGTFVAAAVLMILYGVGANLNIGRLIGSGGWSQRFSGSLGNSAYVAAYLIFATFFAVLAIRKKLLLAILVALFGLFLILTGTRGAYIGVFVGVIGAIIYMAVQSKKWRKPALGILAALIVLGGALFALKNTAIVQHSPAKRIFEISLSAQTFGTRLAAWRIAWKGFLERPIFGWGPGNYLYLFQHINDPAFYNVQTGDYGAWFDEAHSIVFDNLAETGVVGTLAFLGTLAFALWRIWGKRTLGEGERHTPLRALALGTLVAYVVQGLVLFNVLSIYLPLWAFLAWSEYALNPRLKAT